MAHPSLKTEKFDLTLEPEKILTLEEGRPVTVKVKEAYFQAREIREPDTKRIKVVETLQLVLTHVNGVPGNWILGLTAKKAHETLRPMIDSGSILKNLLVITKRGRGFFTEYEVRIK